jgi:hypothetical protein
MKLYQLHRTHEAGSSAGFEYFASKREAEKAVRDWRNQVNDPVLDGATVQEIEVEPTRAGILSALNRYAGHPNNG